MSRQNFDYIRFEVIKASRLKDLYRRLDDEPRPFELVVHPPVAGARPVTIKATGAEDARHFKQLLRSLAYEPDKIRQ